MNVMTSYWVKTILGFVVVIGIVIFLIYQEYKRAKSKLNDNDLSLEELSSSVSKLKKTYIMKGLKILGITIGFVALVGAIAISLISMLIGACFGMLS